MNFQFHDYEAESESMQTAVVDGLTQSPKQLHPKLFYDETGSRIFDEICDQPEYYLPEVERSIFEKYADEIIDCMGDDCHIIEPGAGGSSKIRFFLDRMSPAMYVPMDISGEHLKASAQQLAAEYPRLPIHAICIDHTKPYSLPDEIPEQNRVFFYPGSSLSNFEPDEAVEFLRDIHEKAGNDGGLLIGIDTKKPAHILNQAYNDDAGVTALFNLNLLKRIRDELDSDIDLEGFEHHAFYNEEEGRVEMHLRSREKQMFRVNGHTFSLDEGECIHTENSYKYDIAEFKSLAEDAGWNSDEVWLDGQQFFSVHFLRN